MSKIGSTIKGNFLHTEPSDGLQLGPEQSSDEWDVCASSRHWGVRCRESGNYIDYHAVSVGYSQRQHSRCPCHGFVLDNKPAIRAGGAAIVSGEEAIHGHVWWHSSPLRPEEFKIDAVRHVGTKDAALHRMLSVTHDREERFLYKVTLLDFKVAEEVWVEVGGSQIDEVLREKRGTSLTDRIFPYVNQHEAPGDLSLLIPPRALATADLTATASIQVVHRHPETKEVCNQSRGVLACGHGVEDLDIAKEFTAIKW